MRRSRLKKKKMLKISRIRLNSKKKLKNLPINLRKKMWTKMSLKKTNLLNNEILTKHL